MYPDPSTVLPQGADPTNASAKNPASIFGLSNLPTTLNAQQVQDFQKMTIPSQAPTDLTAQIMGFNQPIQQLESIQKEQETGQTQTQNAILNLMNQLSGKSQFQAQAEEQAGLPALQNELLDLEDLQRQQTMSYLQGFQNIQGKPIAMEFITGQQEQLNRQRAIDVMMTTALIESKQGRIKKAEDTVKRMVDAKYDPIIRNIETAKFILEQQGANLSRTDKKLLEAKSAQAEVIKAKKQEETDIQNMLVEASRVAPTPVISNARKIAEQGGSKLDIAQALGEYAGDYWGTRVKIAQYSNLLSEAEKRRSEIATAGVGSTSKVDATEQAKFLLDTISESLSLSSASGRSKARRGVEAYTVGATDYTNLEAKVRTVKNNLLTLATDPNIKKFFGPQMTENDVKNMMSAASTLDTENQSPQELKKELERAQKIFQKFVPDYVPQKSASIDDWSTNISTLWTSPSGGNYGFIDKKK